jgi:hypothetical protein
MGGCNTREENAADLAREEETRSAERAKRRARAARQGPHCAYWAQCEDCEVRTRELEAAGCTRSDAQVVAEGEHMLANCRREGA